GRALEADAGLTPRVDGGSGELEVEGDGLGDTTDRQVSGDPVDVLVVGQLDAGRLEADLGMLVHGEEVAAPQVSVPICVAGVDRGDLDDQLGGRLGRVVAVDVEGPLELIEAAPHLGDHGVAGNEAGPAVGWVDRVGAGQIGLLDGRREGFTGHCVTPSRGLGSSPAHLLMYQPHSNPKMDDVSTTSSASLALHA